LILNNKENLINNNDKNFLGFIEMVL